MPPPYKNMVFCNLFYSGSSAIAPILWDLLPQYGIPTHLRASEIHLLVENPRPPPHFSWSHLPPEYLIPALEQDQVRVVFLHRDPRDVAISYYEDRVLRRVLRREDERQIFMTMEARIGDQVRAACRWVTAATKYPIKIIRFDDMKKDVLGTVLDCLSFYGLTVDERLTALASELCAKHSFENVAKRPRGSDGDIVRNIVMVRKGMSGEWRQRFDEAAVAEFDRAMGAELRFLGY